jgi:hypothetical protein
MQEILFACIVQTVGSILKTFKRNLLWKFNFGLKLFGKKQPAFCSQNPTIVH